jgi:hypothetical protein
MRTCRDLSAAHEHECRLISLARWDFTDVWSAFSGSLPTAVAVLGRWPHLDSLAAAQRLSVTAVAAEHTHGVSDIPARLRESRHSRPGARRMRLFQRLADSLARMANGTR